MTRGIGKIRSDATVRSFVSAAKKAGVGPGGAKLADGGGLHLKVLPSGAAVWRIKYRFGGKERLYAGIGAYPEVGLEAARSEREAVREHLRAGRDPSLERKVNRAEAVTAGDSTFEPLARAWLAKQKAAWSEIHYDKSERAIERDVLPKLGALPIGRITPALVSDVIQAIERRGARDTAGKVLQHVTAIFTLGQARGLRTDNPATPARAELSKRKAHKSRPALLKWDALGEVLRGAETAALSPSVRLGHRLCAFTVARVSNVVQAEWPEFDLDGDVPAWTVPRAKMKVRDRTHDHKIILGPTIAAELRAWRAVTGGKGYVLPSPAGGKHITRESLEKAYRETLGLRDKHTPHGWRSAMSTLARDQGFERDVVELTLDHIHDNEVARAYDRGERLQQRIKLMHWWDAQLVQAQRGADVITLKVASQSPLAGR